MTTVFCTSSYAGVAFLVAVSKASHFGRTVLLIANEAKTPEIVPAPWEMPGFDTLAANFAEVIRLNELIAPLHPASWRPPAPEVPVLVRLLATRLAPDDAIDELVVESVIAGSGAALVELIPDVPITIADHSLLVYGPPVPDASSEIGGRVRRLVHLDLVPELQPLLRYRPDVVIEPIAVDEFTTAIGGEIAEFDAVLLGDRDAERGSYAATIRALAAGGHRNILFAPHPQAAPEDLSDSGRQANVTIGLRGASHEALAATTKALVVGSASPALFLAAQAATSGAVQISRDRMAVALADAALPRLEADGSLTHLSADLAHVQREVARQLANPIPVQHRPRNTVRRIAAKVRSRLRR